MGKPSGEQRWRPASEKDAVTRQRGEGSSAWPYQWRSGGAARLDSRLRRRSDGMARR
jgi:hypothetical protein